MNEQKEKKAHRVREETLDRRRKLPHDCKQETDSYVGDIDDSSAFESERGKSICIASKHFYSL